MAIEKQVYSFVLTIISIHFALSVFGCHKSKNSTAETQKALKSQTGLASFYGSAFYGKKTASGERFDQTDWWFCQGGVGSPELLVQGELSARRYPFSGAPKAHLLAAHLWAILE